MDQGQTKAHMIYAISMGVKQLIVAVNKMDMITYNELQYVKVKTRILAYLTQIGYNKKRIHCIPLSAFQNTNISSKSDLMPWYEGKTLFETLDSLHPPTRHPELPFRMPVQKVQRVPRVGWVIIG